jgi:hypothetical protein
MAAAFAVERSDIVATVVRPAQPGGSELNPIGHRPFKAGNLPESPMAIEPQPPLPPELPGPGQDIPPPEVPMPTDPVPTPSEPPTARRSGSEVHRHRSPR